MKKAGSILLSAVLMTSLLAGCGDKAGNEGAQSTETTFVDGKYSPPITISIGKQQDENAGKYFEGESLNDNVLTRWGVENLGIKVETTLLGGDGAQYNNKLRLSLTGSEKLPHVIPVYDTMLMNDLIQSGRVKDITDDIKNEMPERLKEIYKQYPTTFNPIIQDGKWHANFSAVNGRASYAHSSRLAR
jgi:putative aldouronate transport system substrate-binding protein